VFLVPVQTFAEYPVADIGYAIAGDTLTIATTSPKWPHSGGPTLKSGLTFGSLAEAYLASEHDPLDSEPVAPDEIRLSKETIDDLESKVRHSGELQLVKKLHGEREKVRNKLRDELGVIRMRKMVPGRCPRCPF